MIYFDKENVAISRNELLKMVVNCHGLICLISDRIDKEVIDAAGDSLRVISTISVGYNHIDVQLCKEKNIQVGFTPGDKIGLDFEMVG